MEQHDIDTYVLLAVAQYGRDHSYTQAENFHPHRWVVEAMKMAYNHGKSDGWKEAELHLMGDDNVPF